MSYQMPPSGGPPRSTPIPGQSTPIPGTGPAQFQGVPTPGVFLGGQGVDAPPPVKVKKDRNWGFWFMALLIVGGTLAGVGAAIWSVFVAKDAADKATEITIPDLSGNNGGDDNAVSELIGGGPAASVAALEASILGDPTNFVEIILYPDYAFATAQDPTQPDHIDRYMLQDGTLGTPEPQTNDPDAASKVFTIDAVQWDAIAALAGEAPRLAAVEEGKVTHIYVNRDVFTEVHDVVVRVYISGPRGNAFIEAAPDGTVLRIV